MLSMTVTRSGGGYGGGGSRFAADSQRLNVALTRARSNLLVVGDARAMQAASPVLRDVLQRCRWVLLSAGKEGGARRLSEGGQLAAAVLWVGREHCRRMPAA